MKEHKFVLTGIDDSRPLNHYISPTKLKTLVQDHAGLKAGESVRVDDNLTLSREERKKK